MTAAGNNAITAADTEARDHAAAQLYDAECALHAAHQAHVDAWVTAAADHLHAAVIAFDTACAKCADPAPADLSARVHAAVIETLGATT